MTPERKEEIKRDAQSGKGYEDAFILNQEVLELLAALEEAQQQTEKKHQLWREAIKGWSNTEESLAEAQQTIARQREALEPEQRKSIIDHCSDLNRYDDDNFSAPVCIDELPEEDKAEVMEWLYVLLGACAENAVDSVTDLLAAFEEGETQP